MPDIETLSHTTWDCKYHVVFIPQYRRQALYHELRRHLGEVFRALAAPKECRIEEGHVMGDHVHMLLALPPKYSTGHHCWARGYDVSTVGRDEAVIREYIRTQEAEDRRLDQMDLW